MLLDNNNTNNPAVWTQYFKVQYRSWGSGTSKFCSIWHS